MTNAVQDLATRHHRWMIRTFWWSLLWGVIGGALSYRDWVLDTTWKVSSSKD
jgi:uncharacterized membrane protein